MDEDDKPLAKKPRMDNEAAVIKISESSESSDDGDIYIVDENGSSSSASSTQPRTLRTSGSKRKSDSGRDKRYHQRENKRKSFEQEEKERIKQEREHQKQTKLVEKLEKEAEKKQKQLEREKLKLEKEDAKKKKDEEGLRKKAEREEATRKAKEEKQRIADEKQRAKEEAKRKAERIAPKLDKFLVKIVTPEPRVIQAPCKHWLFPDFEIKRNMTVAPVHRRNGLTEEEKENFLKLEVDESDYLQNLPLRPSTKIIKMKAKFFQFHSEYRPAYFGTWRKRSKIVTGRRPFAKDTIKNYEYDSDDEWEDEAEVEGEQCESDEEDFGKDDTFIEDDGFVVPHGYLSSDEGEDSDDGAYKHLPRESSEMRRRRMKKRADEWRKDHVSRIQRNRTKLVPYKYGPCFSPPDNDIPLVIKNNLYAGILLNYSSSGNDEREDSDDSQHDV